MTDTRTVRKIAVDDVAPNTRRGGDIRVLLSPKTVGSTTGFMGVTLMKPGEFVAEHYHPYSDEFMYVVRGAVETTLGGDQTLILTADEGILVPRNLRHRVRNIGSDDARIVFQLCPLAPRPELGHVETESRPGEG